MTLDNYIMKLKELNRQALVDFDAGLAGTVHPALMVGVMESEKLDLHAALRDVNKARAARDQALSQRIIQRGGFNGNAS